MMARTRRAISARPARALSQDDAGPAPLLLSLQQTIGNQGVLRLLQRQDAAHHSPLALAARRTARPAAAHAVLAQRCGGEAHQGCACAADASTVERQVADPGPIARAGADSSAAAGSRPPLTSPRFAGDAVLEACHQDQARLTQGARGASVQKVQQALLDQGFDLGPKGADASYGPGTAKAVREFKAKERLGFEEFGDVGPGTMTRLDQLFPPVAPGPSPSIAPAFAEEENGLFCPNPADVVAALVADPALTQALASRGDAAVTRAPSIAAGGANHIDIPTAVARFNQLVDVKTPAGAQAGPVNISNTGQFFVYQELRSVVEAELRQIGGSGDADAVQFGAVGLQAVNAIHARSKTAGTLIGALDRIAAKTKSPQKAAMQAVLRDLGGGGAIDAQIFAAFDLTPNDTLPPGILVRFRSLRALQAVLAFDSAACGGNAIRVAQRIKRKGGLVKRQAKTPSVSAVLASGSGFEDRRPMGSPSSAFEPAATSGVSLGGIMMFGDVILQSGVSGVVGQIKQALDNGKTVHARVLSGLGYGIGTTATGKTALDARAKRIQIGPPPEEHSVLIIGFDGDTFVFHDSDAAVSKTPEAGFGELFFDSSDNRLSTAKDPADLLVLFNTHDHVRGDHRYQVIRVESI